MTDEELLQVIEQAAEEGAPELDLSGNNLTVLHNFLKNAASDIQCTESFKMVDVRRLIDDVNLPRDSQYRESLPL